MKVSDLIKRPPTDQKAQTVAELALEWGIGACQAAKMVRGLLTEGRIEKVLKKANGKTVAAYRVRSKP